MGVVTTTALARFAFLSAYSGAGVSGVNRSNLSVSTERRITPEKALRRHPRLNSRRLCGTTCTTSISCVASMNPSRGQMTVVFPSPMSICAHSAPSRRAAATKSRTSATWRRRSTRDCAYSNTSMRGSYERASGAPEPMTAGLAAPPEPPSVNRFFRDSSEDSSEVVASK